MKYQSAAPFLLYDAPSGLDSQEQAPFNLFTQTLRRPGLTSALFRVFESESIVRKPTDQIFSDNPVWNQFIRDNFGRQKSSDLPGCYLTSLRDCFINNHVIYFGGSTETTMLYEMHWPPDRPSTAPNHSVHLRLHTEINSYADDTQYFYLGSSGSTNYGHWLSDDLPRLAAVVRYREMNPGARVTILITEAKVQPIDDVRRASVLRHPSLSDVTVQLIDPAVIYRFDHVLYATPVSYHPIAKLRSGIRYVREVYGRVQGRGTRKIYMTRPKSSRRKLTNGSEIEGFLRKRGFEVFDSGTMTFEEQIGLFSEAAVVVGIMGAAMSNTIFSPPGTSVIYLSCKGWPEPYFWDLADACGHEYACVYGQPAHGETMPHLASFRVELDHLKAALGSAV